MEEKHLQDAHQKAQEDARERELLQALQAKAARLPDLRFAWLAQLAAQRRMQRKLDWLAKRGYPRHMATKSEAFLDAQDAKESTKAQLALALGLDLDAY